MALHGHTPAQRKRIRKQRSRTVNVPLPPLRKKKKPKK